MPDVARRCANELRHRMRLAELAHVDARHLTSHKEELVQRASGLGLVDAGGTEEQESSERSMSMESRCSLSKSVSDTSDHVRMSDDVIGEMRFELKELLGVRDQKPLDGYANLFGDDLCDRLAVDYRTASTSNARPCEIEETDCLVR